MGIHRMHAAVAEQAHQVKTPSPRLMHRREKSRVTEEVARENHQIQAGDVHMDDATRADIQVSHLAVAHLTVGQADKRS
jgi:hypothetical protein